MAASPSIEPGFHAIHANHLEDLRRAVVFICRQNPMPPLQSETFLVQSNGIAQWLKLALAEKRTDDGVEGGLGIAAGMDFLFPARFIWQAYRAVLPDGEVPEQSPFDKRRLVWRLYRLLPELVGQDAAFTPLARFLDGSDTDLRNFQLAEKVADLFDQYQVFRADWLAAWEQGKDVVITARGEENALDAETRWQPLLWRKLVEDVGSEAHTSRSQIHTRFMEQGQRISDAKMNRVNTGISTDEVVKDLVRCGYVKSADLADRFGNPADLDPELDLEIVGPTGIFSRDEFNNNREFRKTASVMKLVLNGYAGAGTITIGGYDYHTGERGTGERRDELAGRCMGACLEYAARVGMPLMLYVFSDGSVSSNGRIDDSADGRGKGEWTGDNQQTAASFFLVYNPGGRPTPIRRQIGFMRSDASVETASSPAANNVNQLVQTVLLNYMALHGEQADFGSRFNGHGLGNSTSQDSLIAFSNVVNGTIGN